MPAAAAMSLAGMAYAQAPTSGTGGTTDTTGATQPVNCAEGRNLMLLEYWAFVRNNPECRPKLDQDKPWVDSLSGFVNAPECEVTSHGIMGQAAAATVAAQAAAGAAPDRFEPAAASVVSSVDLEALYQETVGPAFAVSGPAVEHPAFVCIGGQQGAGKSSIRLERLLAGTVQHVIVDNIDACVRRIREPDFDGAAVSEVELARVSGDFTWRLIKRAILKRYHVVFELAYPGLLRRFAELARDNGYWTEANVLAVNLTRSFTDMFARHIRNAPSTELTARMPGRRGCRSAYGMWASALIDIENLGYVDRVVIRARGGAALYENSLGLVDGAIAWQGPLRAFETLLLERNRPVPDTEADEIAASWEQFVMHPTILAEPRSSPRRLARERAEVLAWCGSAGRGFDVTAPSPRNTAKARTEWLAALEREVNLGRAGNERLHRAPNYDQLAAAFLAEADAASLAVTAEAAAGR